MKSQDALYKLHLSILYERSGSYSKIKEIIARSGIQSVSSDKYFAHNIFQSLCLQGLIDVAWLEPGIKWCASKSLFSMANEKSFVFAEALHNEVDIFARIFSKKIPIGYCYRGAEIARPIDLRNFSPVGEIADQILIEQQSPMSLSVGDSDIYSFEENKWEQGEIDFHSSVLVRQRDRFCGYRYFVFICENQSAFKISEPEWLFVISAYMLNIDIEHIFRFENNVLRVNSSFRLPTLLSRYLYQSSELVNLDYVHEYHDVVGQKVDELFSYLSPGRA